MGTNKHPDATAVETELASSILPIAVIGIAFRGPGDATCPQKLWDMCCRGRDAWTEVPKDRINADGFWHPEATKPGCFNSRGGHFLKEDVSRFDAPFFSISPNEAKAMDPQQRLVLESSYEALENAGIPLQKIAGTKTAVFVGFCGSDYCTLLWRDPETAPRYQTTGSAFSILANRVSYFFDLNGPSCTLDTACSSSLTAVHLACQTLRLGQAEQAIAGGVGVLLSPDTWSGMSSLGLFSEEGRCFSFDSRASGYGRGEGVATVVLKPLDSAIRDNDNIHSVIRHTGVNHDGRTRGIVLPNQLAQTELIERVYREAGLDVRDTYYVEAHGPGTAVGDPIEADAITKAIAAHKPSKLLVGSVKSNIGHMEGASGLAGLIKTCMILREGKVPPNAGFQSPNNRIPLQDWNLKVVSSLQNWPSKCVKQASVSSFGFGGANSHIILEGPPQHREYSTDTTSSNLLDRSDQYMVPAPRIIVLSAADSASTRAQAASISEYIRSRDFGGKGLDLLKSLAFTLASRRSHLDWRFAVPACSMESLLESLNSSSLEIEKTPVHKASLSFIFSGQGSKLQATGQQLMSDFPVFAAVMEESHGYLQEFGATWSLKDVIRGGSGLAIDTPYISQPATTAIQVGIVSLLKSWGILPAKVVGHSSGEFAAAYTVGALSLRSCLLIAYHRGRLASNISKIEKGGGGAMLAVGASAARVNAMLRNLNCGKASVACINSPSLVVVSGDETVVQIVKTVAESEKLFVQGLHVDVAYHSYQMEAIADEYLACLEDVRPCPGSQRSFYSSLRGQVSDQESLGAMYWVEHLISPVNFSAAVEDMLYDFRKEEEEAQTIFVEIGPNASLRTAVADILRANRWTHDVTYLPSLRAGKDATMEMLQLASKLFAKGQPINLDNVNFPIGSSGIKPLGDLPPYPWNHDKSYWHESRLSRNYRLRPFRRNDLIGSLVHDYSDIEPRWRNLLRTKDAPWLLHHKIHGVAVFPFAGFLAMALEALKQWTLITSADCESLARFELREVLVSRPMVIPKTTDLETSIVLRASAEGTRSSVSSWNEFTISSWTQEQGWTEHSKGMIRLLGNKSTFNRIDENYDLHQLEANKMAVQAIDKSCGRAINCEKLYQSAAKAGIEYGPSFQNLHEARAGPGLCVGHVRKPDVAEFMPRGHQTESIIHPALLDALLHPLLVTLAGDSLEPKDLQIPAFIKSFSISSKSDEIPPDRYICYGTSIVKPSGQLVSTSLKVFDQKKMGQTPYMQLEGITGPALPQNDWIRPTLKRELCFKLAWLPVTELNTSSQASTPQYDKDIDDCVNSQALTFIYSCHPGNDLIQSIKEIFGTSEGMPRFVALEAIIPENTYYVFLDHLQPILPDLDSQRLGLLQALIAKAAGILWVTCGTRAEAERPESSMSAGWTRCLRREMANVKIVSLDLQAPTTTTYRNFIHKVHTIVRDVLLQEFSFYADKEFAEVDGVLTVPRLQHDIQKDQYIMQQVSGKSQALQPYKQEDRNLQARISRPGLLQSIVFVDNSIDSEYLGDDQVEIEVRATGMNFKDVMIGLGQVQHQELGLECSGILTRVGIDGQRSGLKIGDRVCAISEKCYANRTRASFEDTIKIPDEMSFATAASIPIVYSTAYHALFNVGRLSEGEAVLIHSAAGGVGQAAIMLAQHAGAEVYVTISSEEKRSILIENYGIPRNHIFSSRATNFERGILDGTNGRGVALVISSVSAEMRRLSINVLAPLGRFIEIGKRDLALNVHLELDNFTRALTFAAVDLEILAREHPPTIQRILKAVFDALREHPKAIKPVTPVTSFPISQLENAMRTMQGGKHMGKIVIESDANDLVLADLPLQSPVLRSEVSYLITGGTGGIGMSLARWMATEGAKSIVLVSRTGGAANEVQTLVQDMEKTGTSVVVLRCDVGSETEIQHLISNLASRGLPPIAGVIHGAMVLRDVLFEKSSIEDYQQVIMPRVKGAWNIHNALLAGHSDLDFFVVLSSATGILGNPGQSAYAASNSFLDAFARYRHKLNLPASSIDLGLVESVGYVAQSLPKSGRHGTLVHDRITERELHALVKAAIADRNSECDYAQTITGVRIDPTKALPFWAKDPIMSMVLPTVSKDIETEGDEGASVRNALRRCPSRDEAIRVMCVALTNKLSAISLTPKKDLDVHKNMDSYGLDSLVAVEIRNWMTTELGVNLSLVDFMKATTLLQLSKTAVGKSRLLQHLEMSQADL